MLRCESCFEISRGGDGVMRMVLGGRLAVWNWGTEALYARLFFWEEISFFLRGRLCLMSMEPRCDLFFWRGNHSRL